MEKSGGFRYKMAKRQEGKPNNLPKSVMIRLIMIVNKPMNDVEIFLHTKIELVRWPYR